MGGINKRIINVELKGVKETMVNNKKKKEIEVMSNLVNYSTVWFLMKKN